MECVPEKQKGRELEGEPEKHSFVSDRVGVSEKASIGKCINVARVKPHV